MTYRLDSRSGAGPLGNPRLLNKLVDRSPLPNPSPQGGGT